MKKYLSLLGFIVVSNSVLAGQTAQLVCTQTQVYYQHEKRVEVCLKQELIVDIAADGDGGRFGEFTIGIKLGPNTFGVWSEDGGWHALDRYSGVESYPADGKHDSLPANRHFVVFRGTPNQLCEMARQKDFQIYAGHAVLNDEEMDQIRTLSSKNQGIASSLEASYLKRSLYQEGNYGVVYEGKCRSFRD